MPAVVKSVGQLPAAMLTKLDQMARENERSRAAELRVAVKSHLKKHGVK